MRSPSPRSVLRVLAVGVAALLGGCATDTHEAQSDDDLTSLTARQRVLTFEGVVYVAKGASDHAIEEAARAQARSAFGALLHEKVSVQSREVHNVDTSSFRKREVLVVDTDVPGDRGKTQLEVRYRYVDNALVPVELSRHTGLSLALLGPGAGPKTEDVLVSCTKNDEETRKDVKDGFLWYDFDAGRATCRRLMEREGRAIEAAAAKLEDTRTMVSRLQVERLILPTTMALAKAATATRATYPEYDKLFGGGVDPNALVVSIVAGRVEHHHVEATKDLGYFEWISTLDTLFRDHPEFELTSIEPQENLTVATVNEKRYDGLTFENIRDWTLRDKWPDGVRVADRRGLAVKIGEKLDNHWLTFEKKVKVATGDKPARDFTLRILTLFGAEEDPAPHKRALKGSDVVLYSGHSYIGEGPLDPSNFRATSFPETYQLFFFNSCVSYNYYEKDFFTLKPGGSKSVDIITNGIEVILNDGGIANGRFLARLLDGSMPSYQALLEAAKSSDALRVVDGEVDNAFDPDRTKIRLSR
jgi:hypothetical protein